MFKMKDQSRSNPASLNKSRKRISWA